MDLIITYLGLRYLASLLRTGDQRAMGEKLDHDLNEVAAEAGSCLGISCGCYALLCIVWLLSAIVDWAVASILGR